MMEPLHSLELNRYPRTAHLQGSRLQDGDDGADQVPLTALAGKHVVIEEKFDGANCGLSFSAGGDVLLQSRGHYLTGGGRERQFNWLKPWAHAHADALLARLEDRWVLYGEAMHAKHSVWYDRLPHLLLEFDLLDRRTGRFASTLRRQALLKGLPIVSVPVLYAGPMPTEPKQLKKLVFRSLAKSRGWRQNFEQQVAREGLPLALTWRQTNPDDESEGLYLKVENEDFVEARYKWVRAGFTQTILDSGSHHLARPILPNLLASGADLYAPVPTLRWETLGLQTITSIEALRAFNPRAFVAQMP
ncbi:RNA ligase family protein [Ottowia testudinis]|uniref:RNA ligase family protein n=1 Tax=Ottowia testudinis TaxID=2816950 RepID=A0A975CK81_9BURK|nr:RNA ligase family protein [Ottowia testudinis]QTD45719.1 RNA ligase family protein [Ottowia testudinis]